jgi:hypothetical protein
METTLLAFLYKIPKVRLVRSLFWFELAHVCSLAIVTRFAGSGTVLPSGLATFTNRQNMVQCCTLICNMCATVLAKVLISQEDVTLAQSHGALGLLIFM